MSLEWRLVELDNIAFLEVPARMHFRNRAVGAEEIDDLERPLKLPARAAEEGAAGRIVDCPRRR